MVLFISYDLSFEVRCDADVKKIITSLTVDDLITSQNGMTASRSLVNVVIDQQIGQQISVSVLFDYVDWVFSNTLLVARWIPLARFCNNDVAPSVVQVMLCCTK